jgi:UDP-3-O-[3-hydroxymyristoyl] glucosamine N-acyltransferase
LKNIFVKDILPLLGDNYKIMGNIDLYFNNISPSESVNEYSLDWVNPLKKNKLEYIRNSKAKIIICEDSLSIDEGSFPNKCLIFIKNPKFSVLKILDKYFNEVTVPQIHPSAILHPEAEIAEDCYIGPFTYIGKCKIQKGTVIHGNCYIYDNVAIGKNVIIKAGTVIGGSGFAYLRNDKGHFEKFPQIGGVIIEDNVEIGSNTAIDRGALGETIIGEGAKIDNLVHISHNVKIGKHSAIIANTVIGGSTVIGDYSWVSPSVSILDQLKIGSRVTLGVGAVIVENIPDSEKWTSIPAMSFHDFLIYKRKLKKGTS